MNRNLFGSFLFFISTMTHAQEKLDIHISTSSNPGQIIVTAGGQPFTSFLYPDSLEKPVLYPIYAPDQEIVTRGFPIETRPNESTDHPHHIGLWFNYENVNGLDFWNNSYAIPAEKKSSYGWIKTNVDIQTKNGQEGNIRYTANWVDQKNNILLKETTLFIFTAYSDKRIIDRITTLTAEQDLSLADSKDGLLGLRVTHELELPSAQPKQFTDNKGNVTTVAANASARATGNYLTSEGKQGDSAWGTRARWCMLYGKKNDDTISIVIIDHPRNPGYPTYWHARGYGLFAANPLGEKIFSNGKETMDFKLKKGSSATFRYRIVIASDKKRLDELAINRLESEFSKLPD